MINPLKRAAIALGTSVAIITSILCVPGLHAIKSAAFFEGLAVGLGGAAVIVIIAMLIKRKKLQQNG